MDIERQNFLSEHKPVKATYVSSWDHGSDKIESSCLYNPDTREVTDIESVDVEELELNYLDEEWIELADGTIIKDFTRDGVEIKDGQVED
jgi:hypothetical protein